MHVAQLNYCDAHRLSSPIQVGANLGHTAGLLAQTRKQLGHPRSPFQPRCKSSLTRGQHQHRAFAPIHQTLAQSHRERGQGKKSGSKTVGRGQVRLFYLLYSAISTNIRLLTVVCLQLCIVCCEPHSYHERPHTYANNPPTPGLRLALGTESADKASQRQQPDHPKALDAL